MPKTVFISSRIEELGGSRRAAFDAVLESGLIPLVFEQFPDRRYDEGTLSSAHPAPAKSGLANFRQRVNDRRYEQRAHIDDLLSFADLFIGIYADSMGSRDSFLNGLRPIEYEFVRFMLLASNEGNQQFRIDDYFPRVDVTGVNGMRQYQTHEVEPKTRDIMREIGRQLSAWKYGDWLIERVSAQEGDSLAARSVTQLPLSNGVRRQLQEAVLAMKEELPYAKLFDQRVRLFEKRYNDDRPISSHLVRNMMRKPSVEYRSYSEPEVGTGRLVHFPNTSHLFRKTYEWLSLVAPQGRGGIESSVCCGILVALDTKQHPGYLLRVLQHVYHNGFNVEGICFTTQNRKPGIAVAISPFHNERGVLAMTDRINNLRNGLHAELVSWEQGELHYHPSTVTVDLIEERNVHGLLMNEFAKFSHRKARSSDNMWEVAISAEVANVPGMFYRLVERIHAFEGAILDATMCESKKGPRRSEIAVRAQFPDHSVRVRDGRGRTYNALDVCLRNELRFLLGVYDVNVVLANGAR